MCGRIVTLLLKPVSVVITTFCTAVLIQWYYTDAAFNAALMQHSANML